MLEYSRRHIMLALPSLGLASLGVASVVSRRVYAQPTGLGIELVHEETLERDRLDTQRKDSPLIPAQDSWVVDTSDLNVDQVVELLLTRAARLGEASRK